MINVIRRLRNAEPFQAFRIRLKDGRTVMVNDPFEICFNRSFTQVCGTTGRTFLEPGLGE